MPVYGARDTTNRDVSDRPRPVHVAVLLPLAAR